MKNNYSEDLELASLLVKIDIFPAKVTSGAGAAPSTRYRALADLSRTCPR